ncbi:Peroxidasin-like [Oopsacas minuta]|uniref:Peroxidasin-like n=1 Tax=Oopsacas minuta TaxID=111878 RepID=A0AAV7JW92_9METZ|nr:Peroxidasin-like [Oopsacas minuta]
MWCASSELVQAKVHFPPLIISQLSDQLIAPGESVSLLCTAGGNPVPQLSWEGPNGTIPGSSSGLLSLTNIQSDAEGEYTCIATNYIDTVSIELQIIVTAPPEVSIVGGSQSVIEGQKTSIQCQILSGNPVPQISWFRDNLMLTSSQDSISISLSNQISTLSISPALRSDTNNYTCRVGSFFSCTNNFDMDITRKRFSYILLYFMPVKRTYRYKNMYRYSQGDSYNRQPLYLNYEMERS